MAAGGDPVADLALDQRVFVHHDACGSGAAPEAALDGPATAATGDAVTLDASGTGDADGNVAGYEWDVDGDGTVEETTEGPTLTHTFADGGEYEATVTAFDTYANHDSAELEVAVAEPPNASLSVPDLVSPNESVTLDASNSTDDAGIDEYRWDTDGDGAVDRTTSDATTTTSYEESGDRTVSVTVVDTENATDTATATVAVEVDEPPTASLAAPDESEAGEEITFDATDSSDDRAIEEYRWDFDGDGTNETTTDADQAAVNHTYDSPGNYTATVTVVDDAGQTANASASISVVEANQPPNASISVPEAVTANESVVLNASASTDGDGAIQTYEWDLDGDDDVDATTGNATYEHSYEEAGEYEPSVTVVDDDGATDEAVATLTVETANAPPTAALSVPEAVSVDESVTLDASDSADDEEVVEYQWLGTTADGETVLNDTTTAPTTTRAFDEAGTYEVAVVVADAEGATDRANATLSVSENETDDGAQNLSAVVDADSTQVEPGETVTFDASGSTPADAITEFRWDFDGDGSSEVTTDADEPTANHTYESPGNYTANLTVVGDGGNVSNASTSIAVVEANEPPNASISVPEAVTANESVTLDASASTDDDDGTIQTYQWNPDGDDDVETTTSNATLEYAYEEPGEYQPAVTVVDDDGETDRANATLTVTENESDDGTQSLSAVIDANATQVEPGDTVRFDATESTSADAITAYEWAFEDSNRTATGEVVEHDFGTTGTYTVELTVTGDDDGSEGGNESEAATDTATLDVVVSEPNDGDDDDDDDGGDGDSDGSDGDGDDGGDGDSGGGGGVDGGGDNGNDNDNDGGGGGGGGGDDGGDDDDGGGGGGGIGGGGGSGGGGIGGDGGGIGGGGGASDAEESDEPEPEPDFAVGELNATKTGLLTGQNATFSVGVANTGNASGTTNVTFTLDDDALATETVELDAGNRTTANVSHRFENTGVYEVGVENASSVAVEVTPAEPRLAVTDVSASAREVTSGEPLRVNATVRNTGGRVGSLDVELELFGEVVAVETVSVPPGETGTASFTHRLVAPGEYTASVADRNVTVAVVAEDEESGPTTTNSSNTDGSSASIPGFTMDAALVATLIALAGAALVRRER
jgi:PKD repeat protein